MTDTDTLRAAVEKYVAWEYRQRDAKRFTLTDLRAALATQPAGVCARCGKMADLAPDGTCWPCAVEYRDEIIADRAALSAQPAGPVMTDPTEALRAALETDDATLALATWMASRCAPGEPIGQIWTLIRPVLDRALRAALATQPAGLDELRARSVVCAIGEHRHCDGNAPNGPAGIGHPCSCACHRAYTEDQP